MLSIKEVLRPGHFVRVFGFVLFLSRLSLSLRSITLLHRNACQYFLSGWERKNILEVETKGERRRPLLLKKVCACFYFGNYPLGEVKRVVTKSVKRNKGVKRHIYRKG